MDEGNFTIILWRITFSIFSSSLTNLSDVGELGFENIAVETVWHISILGLPLQEKVIDSFIQVDLMPLRLL